jgi:hypothetical protein
MSSRLGDREQNARDRTIIASATNDATDNFSPVEESQDPQVAGNAVGNRATEISLSEITNIETQGSTSSSC